MTFTLPYPPSANRYWRTRRGSSKPYVSPEAKAYRTAAALVARRSCPKPLTGDVHLTLLFFRPQASGDLDNFLKVAIDSIRGVAYVDDRQVCEIHAKRFEDKRNPRVEVTVEEFK